MMLATVSTLCRNVATARTETCRSAPGACNVQARGSSCCETILVALSIGILVAVVFVVRKTCERIRSRGEESANAMPEAGLADEVDTTTMRSRSGQGAKLAPRVPHLAAQVDQRPLRRTDKVCAHTQRKLQRRLVDGRFEIQCTGCRSTVSSERLPAGSQVPACFHVNLSRDGSNQQGPRLRCTDCKCLLLKNTRGSIRYEVE